MTTLPFCGSKKRKVRLTSVLLPEPEGPTSATVRPEGTVETHAFQHRVVRLVGEGDIVEFDLAALQRERLRVGGFDELRLAVDDAEHAACRRNTFLQAASAASRHS